MGSSRALLGLLACVGIAAAGCESRPPVVRVQENVIEKTVLEGEWYYLQTVIDSPYSVGYTFVGEQGNLQKIRWEIQEEYLIARRSYEFIAGSEGEGVSGPTSERGTAIAMYRIESHFDIRYEYNSVTGEETNVLVENEEDLRWYERPFMRVDWSRNLITDADFSMLWRIFEGISTEPVAYHIEDPRDPHAPRFERNAEGAINYMDIVNKTFVTPGTVEIDGWGEIPSCWLVERAHLDCAPSEVTLRHSFLRVDDTRDYQPVNYTGDRMDRFGYFVVERAGYDPHYGVVDSSRFRFATRHNLWASSHRLSGDGTPVTCLTNEDCEDGRGSQCDMDYARAHRTTEGLCTLPYRDRAIRPITYHVTSNFPEDLEPDAHHLVDGWNAAFSQTVASLRENECVATGGSTDQCAAERTREDGARVFVLCHSPVRDDDPDACGARGNVANIGDLRYSVIGWVNDPHDSSPLGYGPSAADPETGELINGSAFVYGAEVESLAAWGRDLVAVLNGDLESSELANGTNVEDWIERMSLPEGREHHGHGHAVPLDGEDAASIASAMDFSWARPGEGHRRPNGVGASIDALEGAARRVARRGGYGRGDSAGHARLESLRGTAIEDLLLTPETRIAAGVDPRPSVDERARELASSLRGRSLSRMRALERARREIRRDRCVLEADFTDEGLLGLARSIQRAATSGDGTMEWYGVSYNVRGDDGRLDYDLVRSMLRHPIFEAVTAHEVGHTLGLRHNFAGSSDSINYAPQYWQLRDDGDMQPRAWDPLSEAEIDGRIREFQYSTVMDYGNNFIVTDAAGVGHYDVAAIKMGYGDLVEVFSNADSPDEVAWINWVQTYWGIALREESFYEGNEISAYPYTEFPAVLGGIDRLEQRADVPYTSLQATESLTDDGIYDPLVDAQGRPAVPYRFCSDETSDLDPECLLYDAGADPYETIQSVVDSYWNYYILNSFRRGRIGFEVEPYFDRIYERYLIKLQYANQIYALNRSFFEDVFGGDPSLEPFWTRPDGMGAWTLAVGTAYQALTRIVTTPEPGDYTRATRGDGTTALVIDEYGQDVRASVDTFDGRFLETTWDFDSGFFWFDQLERIGYFYDKTIALQVLVDPESNFVGQDTSSDVRFYAISFHNTFGPSLTSFMGGVLGEDWRRVGARVNEGVLTFPDPLQIESGEMPGFPIDPAASFTIQLYAAVFGMSLIPETYDQSFLDRSRIFVRGGAEGVELDPTVPMVEFTDPRSGLTYVAGSYPDETGREQGVGALMLSHALALQTEGADDELRRYVDNLNVIRSLTWQLGFGI